MELSDYLQLARRNWTVLIVLPILLGLGAFLNANRQPKEFTAATTVLLRPNDPNERLGTANVGTATEIQNTTRIIKSQAKIADGPEVAQAAAKWLGSDFTEAQIRSAVSVTTSDDSNIILVKATTLVPDRSAAIANAVAEQYIDNRRESSIAGLQRAIDKLGTNIEELTTRLADIGRQPEGAARDALLNTTQTQFKSLSERRQALVIDVSLKRGEAEIVAKATPPTSPVSPKPLRTGIIGLVAGLILAAGVALLRDRLDNRLRSRDEAEELTGLPTLAEIPLDRRMSKNPRHIAALQHPDGVTAEAVRSLRVSMRFISLEQPLRIVLVTSAVPGDGKSTVSTNLAASYAVSGVRTLLISADLRRPKVESMMDASGASGLVEILSGLAEDEERRQQRFRRPAAAARPARVGRGDQAVDNYPTPPARRRRPAAAVSEIEATSVQHEAPVEVPRTIDIANFCHSEADNLWVLPAGQPVANPVEILGSPVAKDFFAAAREQFDMVIVDSPPVLPVSDSLVMSSMVDGVIFVASVRQTNYKHVARGVERLQSAQARVLGLVLNRLPKETSNGYYGTSYSGRGNG